MVIILCGKSAVGKDTMLNKMCENGWERIVSCTTRPMREGEVEGREYLFKSNKEFNYMIENDMLIEYRTYNTKLNGVDDVWYYGLSKQYLDEDKNYVVVLDLEGAKNFKNWYKGKCSVLYLYCDDSIREERARNRGSFDETEWNRRLEKDAEDFNEDKLKEVVDLRIKNA